MPDFEENEKYASSVSIIGGADGSTSVFSIGGKGSKRTLKLILEKNCGYPTLKEKDYE
jgi:Na+-transporting methylmalonyl-CoA/oxaloacetate decarboxylase beta subunit